MTDTDVVVGGMEIGQLEGEEEKYHQMVYQLCSMLWEGKLQCQLAG